MTDQQPPQTTESTSPPIPNYTRESEETLQTNNEITQKHATTNPQNNITTSETNIPCPHMTQNDPISPSSQSPPHDDESPPLDQTTKREYLQDKISQMDTSIHQHSIINAASNVINETNKSIGDDIHNDKLKIDKLSEQIEELNKSLKNPLQLSTASPYEANASRVIPSEVNRKRQILLKNLTQSKNELELEMNKLKNEENLLQNRTFVNLSMNGINTSSEVDENINRDKLKNVQFKKETIQGKLNELNRQINNIYEKEKQEKTSKSEIIRNFILNFEHDKIVAEELLAERLKKIDKSIYYDYYKNHENELKLKDEQFQRRIQSEENEARALMQEEQEMKRKEFREAQRKHVKDLKKETRKKMGDAPQQINEVVPKKQFKSAYEINAYLYEQEENRLIEQEKAKRKEKMRHITAEEMDEFTKQADTNHKRAKLESFQRVVQTKELWKERKQLLPKYSSPLLDIIKESEGRGQLELKERQKIDMHIMANQKNLYAKNVQRKYLPHIDPKLKNELETRIQVLNNPRKFINKSSKSSYGRHRKGRIILKKLNPDSFKWRLKLSANQGESKTLPNVKKSSPVVIKTPLDKPINYLHEARIQRNKDNASPDKEIVNYDWEKLINNDSKDMIQNIKDVQRKAEQLQKQAERKAQLMRLQPNDDNLGDEIGNLYINSIQAKLHILNAMTNPNNIEEEELYVNYDD